MKSALILALTMATANALAVPTTPHEIHDGVLYEGSVDRKASRLLRLTSSELQSGVVDDFFALFGMSGREINGQEKSLFPLKLTQGFSKPGPVGFRQIVDIFFEEGEVAESKKTLFLKGRLANTLFDLMGNNFAQVPIQEEREQSGITFRTKYTLGRLSCLRTTTVFAHSERLRYLCELDLQGE